MSKRVGAIPGETKEWILTAAREEFSQCGFQGASLRRICSAAGVTTGALYFFFKGKDDLFRTVLSQVTGPFLKLMDDHYRQERSSDERNTEKGKDADFEISRLLIDFYFRNQQVWDILIHNMSHPAVQQFMDYFVENSTEHYMYLLTNPTAKERNIDRFAVHQFVHMQVDSMLTLISHDFDRDSMVGHSATVVRMLRGAFRALLEE